MAIVTGLEPGAILWKYKKIEKVYTYDRNERRHRHIDTMCYYTVELYSRRARSSGSIIDKELYPFLEKLKIRLNEHESYRDGGYETVYRAIGVTIRRVYDEEEWNRMQIDEVASRYYNRLKNKNMSTILEKHSIFNEEDIIHEMKAAAVDFDLETEWPDEPAILIQHNGDSW